MAVRGIETRRQFLGSAGALVLLADGAVQDPVVARTPASGEEDVSPAEDLMREHGVLTRVLLVYDEAARRLGAHEDLDPGVVGDAAGIVRRFIEDYHEKLEEQHLFPRFEKAHTLVDLVGTLRTQHQAGRRLTERIQRRAAPAELAASAGRQRLAADLREFMRMYRPHAAREDTVLFPALHRIVSPHEYDAMGEEFEDEERRLFGPDGFEKVVDEVAGLERRLGIDALAAFTPTV